MTRAELAIERPARHGRAWIAVTTINDLDLVASSSEALAFLYTCDISVAQFAADWT